MFPPLHDVSLVTVFITLLVDNGFGPFGVILFASRVLWGLIAPLLLTWMAKKTVDMRSTQSATGIFYANSVLMLLGELCALYLEKELIWPM